ncbi:hypothetical protein KXX47_006067 [Aspergillus fumigatus]|nr:hypothetical protein KXX47_006067 [Aspergillus fumigatus]
MPTVLEELNGLTLTSDAACENLVGFSTTHSDLFKRHQLLPVRDLKLLVRDYTPIAKNALTILINISSDQEVLANLAEDDAFIETLMVKITNVKEPIADDIAMLFANLAKSDKLSRLITLKRRTAESVSTSTMAIDQLMDCFVKGAEGRAYFTTRQDYDGVVPVTKLTVFTEHESTVRRKGVASTIKNVAFDIPFHPTLLSADDANLLPYVLLPITGPEEFSEEESMAMLPDLQLLPPDKRRDGDNSIIVTHLETLLLLTTTREGRDKMRAINVYPIIRECHLHVDDEGVREACDRLVQVLMRDEEGEGDASQARIDGTSSISSKSDNYIQQGSEQNGDETVVELF